MPLKISGDFEIDFDKQLGRGGMGAVYLGRQISVNRTVAIKLLKSDLSANEEFVRRFHREAALLARVTDSHVVQVFGAGQVEGQHFYAMEFVDGEDLGARLHGGHKFTIDEILQVGLRVGKAFQAAWKHKIIHRDIKPSNIVVTAEGLIKVMDFGLAKNPESEFTQTEVVMGTAKYMSPEQAMGRHMDIRGDLYSLGAVLYELVTGQPVFIGESAAAMMYQHVHQAPTPPKQVNAFIPDAVQAMILKLLAKEPDDRYPDPDTFVASVKGLIDGVTTDEKTVLYGQTKPTGRTVVGTPKTDPKTVVMPKQGSTGAFALLFFLLLLAGGGAYYYFQVMNRVEPPVETVKKPPAPPSEEIKPPPTAVPVVIAPPPAPIPTPPPAPTPEELKRMEEEKRAAEAKEIIRQGDAETDDERALERYESALKLVESEEVRRKIARTHYRRFSKGAGKHEEGGDWGRATADWAKAFEHADESQKAETESRLKFSRTYADALRARGAREWPRAAELFKELAKDPRAHRAAIETSLRESESELKKVRAMEEDRLARDYEVAIEAARATWRRGAWAEADKAYAALSEPRFAGFAREETEARRRELKAALAPPRGMVFIPSGKFVMGGGRAVEGPEGEASTGAYYIDVRETMAVEYADFLVSVAETGHHERCPRDEPEGKSHKPERWPPAKLETPVTGLDWWDAASYAAWKGKRLPTEAEWEKAAGSDLSGGRRAYPWGNEFRKEGGESFFGVEAMGDGVIEWTADWFQRYPWSAARDSDFGETKKVLRGGVLLEEDGPANARVTFRHWYLPTYRSWKLGFRCVRNVD